MSHNSFFQKLPVELIQEILSYCPYEDLGAQLVCKRWHNIALETRRLPWMRPRYIEEGDDPNFSSPDPSCQEARLPNGENFFQDVALTYKHYLEDPHMLYKDGRLSTLEYQMELRLKKNAMASYNNHIDHVRHRFSSRNPHPCLCLHADLRYENLHPVLRFLERLPICCIQGLGSSLNLHFRDNEYDWYRFTEEFPWDCFEKLFLKYMLICELLKRVNDVIKKGKMENDLMMQPAPTSLLIISKIYAADDSMMREAATPMDAHVYNKEGIRLGQLIALIASFFHDMIRRLKVLPHLVLIRMQKTNAGNPIPSTQHKRVGTTPFGPWSKP